MTADKIFDTVIALMFAESTDKQDYSTNYIATLNIILQDLFTTNNSLRLARGAEELEEAPAVTGLSDEVGYEPALERNIIPLGVAGYLYVDDDETGISNVYRDQYETKKRQVTACRVVEIKDTWGV